MQSRDTISDREFESLLQQPDDIRYAYFVKQVADRGLLWSLWKDGWLLAANDEGTELHPFWPRARFASASALAEWDGAQPREIDLDEWLDVWVPGIRDSGRGVAVFPLPQSRAVWIDIDDLRRDLEHERSLME